MKLNITCIIVLLCVGFAQSQTIDLNEPGSLQMSELNEQQRQSFPHFESAKRARPFNLNSQITNHQTIGIGSQINLTLFQDITHPATVVQKATDINGVVTLTLKLNALKYSYAYIAISPNSYLITVDLPEINQKFSSRSSLNETQSYMIQLDESEFQNLGCGLDETINDFGLGSNLIPPEQDGMIPSPTIPNVQQENINLDATCIDVPDINEPATITIMIVYTSEAQNWSDTNNGGIANSIAVTMALANQVSVNNNLGITFQLAYSGLVDYTEETMSDDLGNLRIDGNGILDEVHDIRQNTNADLVALLNYYTSGNTAGIAYLLGSKYGDNQTGFSTSRVDAAVYGYTFIHEIGHNMGAMHNPYQASDPGPTNWADWSENTWSAGWRWQGSDGNYYADLMSYGGTDEYEDQEPTSRIPYFSDPNHTHLGGVAGDPVLGDNARTLREIKHFVARYKETIDFCNAGAQFYSLNSPYIANVAMGTINNDSGPANYRDFTTLATCMVVGDTQTLNISLLNSNLGIPVKVWVDWNDDNIFDPELELVYDSVSGNANHSANITAPLGVSIGTKRMRIRAYNIYELLDQTVLDSPCGYSAIGEVEDYTINLEAPISCTEAAIPQNLVVGTLTSNTAYISWDSIEGIDQYEVRYREIGTAEWETVSPIWYPYHTINNLVFDTDYEVQARTVCNGTPGNYSSSINFTTLGYCDAGANNTAYEKISNVTFNEINNNSTSTAGYEDFAHISTDVEQGASYAFSASTPGPSYPSDQVLVWIDFNQNGVFSDDGEQVLVTSTSTSPWQGTISIPNDALLGETRMRIRLYDTGLNPNATPCGNSGFGQVEDYILNIIAPIVCDEATIPLNLLVSNLTNDTATIAWDGIPGTSYELRYREVGASEWNQLTNIAENTVTLVSLLFETAYEVQVRSVCNGTPGIYSSNVEFSTIGHCPTLYGEFLNAFITRVRLGDIDNSSGITGYSDFTAISTVLLQNTTYDITLNNGAHDFNRAYAVWIDYNQNGAFDEPEELVWSQTLTNAPEVSGQFIIPETSVLSEVVMRVAVVYTNNASFIPSPCYVNSAVSGEAEDYTLVIADSALSLETFNFGDTFKVFPNPMKDIFYISTQNIAGDDVDVTLTNIAGQKIYTNTLKVPSNGSLSIELPGLSAGMYLVNLVHASGGQFTSKVMKH